MPKKEAVDMATPAELRRDSDPMHRMKTIGYIGSIALMTNNITGPGMICECRVPLPPALTLPVTDTQLDLCECMYVLMRLQPSQASFKRCVLVAQHAQRASAPTLPCPLLPHRLGGDCPPLPIDTQLLARDLVPLCRGRPAALSCRQRCQLSPSLYAPCSCVPV